MPQRYAVRVLNPNGAYPENPVVVEDFGVLAAEDFAWSAVHIPELPDEYPEGAISWYTVDEIRFFAALSLAEPHPRTNGRIWISSLGWGTELVMDGQEGNVQPEELLSESRRVAEDFLAKSQDARVSSVLRRDRPHLVEIDFEEDILQLLQAIEPVRLLHRGLYKFLMASELRSFPQFLEESALSAFISREAALELLRRKFTEAMGRRQKKEDILNQIGRSFPTGDAFVQVLEWEGDELRLPFFSRVALRNSVEVIENLGMSVSFQVIPNLAVD